MTNSWIVKPKPNPSAQLKLVCLPFEGGGSNSFRNWVQFLPKQIELLAIEIPGRGQRLREPLRTRMHELVPDITSSLSKELDRPYALFGHSMGTLLGIELSHHLRAEYQQEATHLFFSGRGAPHLPSKEKPIHHLPEDEFITQIRHYNGTPKEVLDHEELMELMVPILRADFEVCETYSYNNHPKLSCPLSIYGGLQDVAAPREAMQAWAELTEGPFNLRMFPGDHFFILSNTQTLLSSILKDLNEHFTLTSN